MVVSPSKKVFYPKSFVFKYSDNLSIYFDTFIIDYSTMFKGNTIEDVDFNRFNFHSTTTQRNTLHLLRGLQLSRPILLEGSPGVGKTSLVIAMARASCNPITRINLSEETVLIYCFIVLSCRQQQVGLSGV